MVTLVEFRSVTKNFSRVAPISNISFRIEQSTLTTLVGPNGAGKTTIAKLMLGLEKPSEGKIVISPNLKIGYVPQKLNLSSNLPLTVENFLNLLAPNYTNEKYTEFQKFIRFDHLRDKDISQLSGGQFQKLVLIATLLNKLDLLILDEPTQSLDVPSQQELYHIIEKIKTTLGITIFMISHDLFTVMKSSDQVICINGHVCCSGKPSDLNKSQEFIDTVSSLGFYSHYHDHKH